MSKILIESLKKAQLFENMDDSFVEMISQIGLEQSIAAGDNLFMEGDRGTHFYIVLEGDIKLFKNSLDGKESVVRIVGAGEMFAEVIIFERDNYPVSAVSLKKSKLFSIDVEKFSKLLSNEQFRKEFFGSLMDKLRFLTKKIYSISSLDVEERFFQFLEDRYGKSDSYEIDLSKKDLASAIGTIPETFSRMVARLKKRDVISWDKNLIKIL